MVIGETEIFGQLKRAYDLAFTHQHTGALLNRAFQRAFNVAKHIRTETNIQRGSVSIMSAAVELRKKYSPRWPSMRCWSSAPAKPARKPRAPSNRAASKNHRHQPLARTRRRPRRRPGRARRAFRALAGRVRAD